MSCISVTKAVNSLVNKIKFREKRIAQYYREIHDMVSELEDYMGNATELIYRNRLILKRHADFSILPIEADIFSKSIAYCYHEIIDRQLELIKQHEQRLEELKQEIEENKKTSEAINSIVNKQIQEIDIQSIQTKSTTKKIEYKQVNPNNKLYSYLVFLIIIAISLLGALLFTATLRESAVVLLFSVLTGISFGWGIFLFYTYQNLEQYKNELDKSKGKIVERELLVNRIIQGIEKQKQQIEQEKQQIREQNEANVKVVNNKLQQSRQLDATRKIQISQYRDKISKYREIIKRLNQENNNLKEEIAKFQTNSSQTLELQNRIEILEKEIQEKQNAIDSFKEQIEAGEHTKRKADNLERDYKQLFEKYHNRESEIQTLQSDLNNSTNENKRLSSKIASLGEEFEKIQKQHEDCQKDKQELERKCQKLSSQESSLISKNKVLQTQNNSFQSKISDLEKEIMRVREEKQGKEIENAGLSSQISSLKAKNEELQTQSNSFQAKISDLEKEIKRNQAKEQEQKILIQKMNSHITSLYSKNEELQKQVKDYHVNYSEVENELQRLKDENYEYECKCLNLDNQKKYLETDLETEKKISQRQIEDFKLSIAELEEKLRGIQKENRELKSEKCNIEYQIPFLEKENKELHKQNKKYLSKNTELQIELQELKVDYKKLKEDFLNKKSVQQEYLDLQTKFNAIQKENEELRYYNIKLESEMSREIIRRNSSDDELDNNSQSVPAEIESATPTIDNSANSEQDLLYKIADEIIKKACYSKEELIALYRRFNMSIFSGNAKINGWTDDNFGDNLIFEENNRFVIDQEIAAKVRNREVENE